jgi:predicted nucleic acid-binding protein
VIVVDTSVLVDYFRDRPTWQVEALEQLQKDGFPTLIPVVCSQEVLMGARSEREWKVLAEYLGSHEPLAPADPWATHLGAARIFFECRRRGITPRSSVDCLVAQLVLEGDHLLLHADEDYEKIQGVRPLRTFEA